MLVCAGTSVRLRSKALNVMILKRTLIFIKKVSSEQILKDQNRTLSVQGAYCIDHAINSLAPKFLTTYIKCISYTGRHCLKYALLMLSTNRGHCQVTEGY